MKFKDAKKICDGFVAVAPGGSICRWTFTKRKGHVTCGNKVWAKIDGRENEVFTRDEYRELIERKKDDGYRVVPVNMVCLLDTIILDHDRFVDFLFKAYDVGSTCGSGWKREEIVEQILETIRKEQKR